eukprot:2165750-Amphidinium_carterae.1
MSGIGPLAMVGYDITAQYSGDFMGMDLWYLYCGLLTCSEGLVSGIDVNSGGISLAGLFTETPYKHLSGVSAYDLRFVSAQTCDNLFGPARSVTEHPRSTLHLRQKTEVFDDGATCAQSLSSLKFGLATMNVLTLKDGGRDKDVE